MDLNIAAAVWLAARAEGHVKTFIGGQQQQQPESQLVAAMDSKTHHEAAGAVVLPCSLPRVDWPQAPQHCHQGCAGSHALDSTAAVQASGHSVTSAARVALLGHGADELHAGYGRHRSRFRTEVRSLLSLIVLLSTVATQPHCAAEHSPSPPTAACDTRYTAAYQPS